jgi:small subunit ribosomal protein S5
MQDLAEHASQMDSTTINVGRTSATVKGGRRFSFGALVIVGDRRGKVGYGYGKSKEVPNAVEKAQKYAKRTLITLPLIGTTIPHQVEGRFSASKVRLIPAAPGTGVVAGGTVRAILEMAGVSDCLTKCYGSTNKVNVVKAVFDALQQLRTSQQIAQGRGMDLGASRIEQLIEDGKKFMPVSTGEKARGPVNTIGQDRRGGRGGRGGGGGGGGRGGRRGAPQDGGAPQGGADAPAEAPKA